MLGELPERVPDAKNLYSESGKSAGYFREITLLDEQVGKLRQSLRGILRSDTIHKLPDAAAVRRPQQRVNIVNGNTLSTER